MKGKRTFAIILALGLMLALMAGLGMAQGPAPQGIAAPEESVGTAFTYQGKLNDGGSPANGSYDFEFKLYDVASGGTAGGTVHVGDVTVTDGLFTVQLDFGSSAFSGDARWLGIGVRPGSSTGAYTTLIPRQPLTPAPYALSLQPGATIHNTASSGELSALVLESDNGGGVFIEDAASTGVYVESANSDGVYVAEADNNGLYVDWAGADGVRVETALDDGVHVQGASYDGLRVVSAGADGVGVHAAGGDGVYVGTAGNPSSTSPIAEKNGFEVAGAEGAGLYVGQADWDGVFVKSTAQSGLAIESASNRGVWVWSAGDDGVYVYQAGNPTTVDESALKNGFEVAGAEGDGLYVGHAGVDGVNVDWAGDTGVYVDQVGNNGMYVDYAGNDGMYVNHAANDGMYVNYAANDGMYVHRAGNPSTTIADAYKNGFEVAGAEGYGLYVGRADMDGVLVNSASNIGLYVYQAGNYGVYANTIQASHNYGLYTPDNLWALNYHLAGAQMLVAQSGDRDNLEAGDVVAVSGMGAIFADGEAPVALVQRAARGGNVMGVVYSRFVAEEEVHEVEGDGQVEKQPRLHARSAEGPVAPGDYLLVVVLGAAQVKAEALSGGILPGDLLAASASGQATSAAPAEINGLAYYPPGGILGTAMEPLDVSQRSGLIWVLVNPQ